jgi:2-aminoadipate transaminase
MRLGYIIAPEHIHFKLVQAKQASDLHTPSFTQRVAYEVLKTGLLDTHIPTIRDLYGKQCEAMLDSLKRHMPAGVHWNRPEGGMFIWVEVPEGIDTLRLAFVTVPPERIEQGIAVLGELLRAEIAALTPKAA